MSLIKNEAPATGAGASGDFRSDAVVRMAQKRADEKRILDDLLRRLVKRRTIQPEDLDMVLRTTIRKVAETVAAQAVTIFMLDRTREKIRFLKVYYSPSAYGLDEGHRKLLEKKARELEQLAMPAGQGIAGQVIETCCTSYVPDAKKEKPHYPAIDQQTDFVSRSMITVPLVVDGKGIGCVQVINKCPEGKTVTQFAPDDVVLLEEVASYSAKVIQHAFDPSTSFTEREIASYIARLYRLPFLAISEDYDLDLPLLASIGKEPLIRFKLLPLSRPAPTTLQVALSDPTDVQTIQDFQSVTRLTVTEKVVVALSDIEAALERGFPDESLAKHIVDLPPTVEEEATAPPEELPSTDEKGITQLSARIVEQAFAQGASDIHLDPQENELIVRYRIDGVLKEKDRLPKQFQRPLVSRYKIMSNLDIAETRLPQDGRIVFKKFNADLDIDLRVSTAPMNFGERICMRILDKTRSAMPLDQLGFSQYNLDLYRKLLQVPYGMILHCGPTGSGKSMTQFAALNEINCPEWNILTAEDPIEYTVRGINQMQVRPEIDLTFARALRCYLRQDPDIILVGEIRDKVTAEIAVEAALTGHMLFSTLHTNDASSTIMRLVEMGVEPFMISAALAGICAQRLMRRLCVCKKEDAPTETEIALLKRAKDDSPIRIFRNVGCPRCSKSGYKGRVGSHELLAMTDELREMVNRRRATDEIKRAARLSGMRTLFEDAMEKTKLGVTSMLESEGMVTPDEDDPQAEELEKRGASRNYSIPWPEGA